MNALKSARDDGLVDEETLEIDIDRRIAKLRRKQEVRDKKYAREMEIWESTPENYVVRVHVYSESFLSEDLWPAIVEKYCPDIDPDNPPLISSSKVSMWPGDFGVFLYNRLHSADVDRKKY